MDVLQSTFWTFKYTFLTGGVRGVHVGVKQQRWRSYEKIFSTTISHTDFFLFFIIPVYAAKAKTEQCLCSFFFLREHSESAAVHQRK